MWISPGKGRLSMTEDDLAKDEELLIAAARAVIVAFRAPIREQLPASPTTALRLLETALALYDDSKQARL